MKALQKMGLVFATALIMGTVFGCQQPQPAQCVCNCEGPPPEGAKIVIDEKQSETKSEEVKAQPAAPAVAAPVPAAPAARPTPPARVPRKARGRVSAEPGSGMPKVMGEADKTEMQTVFEGFAKAAKERNVGEMKKFTTERLGKSLESSLEKYAERLYRRTDMFSAGVSSGVSIGGTNDLGDGNYDIEIKFGEGTPVHVLFFKEEGKWRLNRL